VFRVTHHFGRSPRSPECTRGTGDLSPQDRVGRIRSCIIRNGVVAEERVLCARDGTEWVDEMLSRLKQKRQILRVGIEWIHSAEMTKRITTVCRDALQERLKLATIRDGDLNWEIADEWSAVDQEGWRRLAHEERTPVPVESKSKSRRS
jgi:hypothetical protein